jgi:hypothetical protein
MRSTSRLHKSRVGYSLVLCSVRSLHVQSGFYLGATHFEFVLLILSHGYVMVQFCLDGNSKLTTRPITSTICHLSCCWCKFLPLQLFIDDVLLCACASRQLFLFLCYRLWRDSQSQLSTTQTWNHLNLGMIQSQTRRIYMFWRHSHTKLSLNHENPVTTDTYVWLKYTQVPSCDITHKSLS